MERGGGDARVGRGGQDRDQQGCSGVQRTGRKVTGQGGGRKRNKRERGGEDKVQRASTFGAQSEEALTGGINRYI